MFIFAICAVGLFDVHRVLSRLERGFTGFVICSCLGEFANYDPSINFELAGDAILKFLNILFNDPVWLAISAAGSLQLSPIMCKRAPVPLFLWSIC